MSRPTIGASLSWARRLLSQAGVTAPATDTRFLLAHALGRSWPYLVTHINHRLTSAQWRAFERSARCRAGRMPLAYVTGEQPFMDMVLRVSPGVPVPRPETELLVERAVVVMGLLVKARGDCIRVLEIGTGSGCIAVSLARALPHVVVTATEIAPAAVRMARTNVRRAGVADRVRVVHTDVFSCSSTVDPVKVDLLISNPPYIATDLIRHLAPEVQWEPMSAFDGGRRGMEVIGRLFRLGASRLSPGGGLILEIGFDQQQDVERLVESLPDLEVETVDHDYQGHARVVTVRRRPRGSDVSC